MNGPQDAQSQNIWDRLRRHKVVQWGIAYAAGAWGLLQGVEYVTTTFHWPEQFQQLATLALLLGLPVVLVIAWYHGDRGEQHVTAAELTILTLLFLLGGGIFWRYEHVSEQSPAPTAPVAAPLPATTPAKSAPTAFAEERASIAVLPFENRSTRQDDAFFVDGIHDDILTQLTKIGALKVTARTSVEQFRETTLTAREIGEQLGVTKVLEGGVQRAGDRVRVTVQLIDAATDAQLWAENYDRELTAANIFTIQSEVAVAVAVALSAALTPVERSRLSAIPTQSIHAWEAFQLGRQRMEKRSSKDLAEAQEFFRKAINLDPTFAQAYAGLADSIWLHADYSGQPVGPAMVKAEEFLGQALRLDPNLPEAITTLAKFAQERREFERAEAGYRRAIALSPNYPMAHWWYAQLLGLQGRDAEALQSTQRAAALDPMSPFFQLGLAWASSGIGRFDESLAGFQRTRNLDPLSPLPYAGIGTVHSTAFGRFDQAIPFIEKAIELDIPGSKYATQLAQIYLDLGDDTEASRWLERAPGDRSANAVWGYLHLYRGDQSRVLTWARRAVETDARDWRALALLRHVDLDANDSRTTRSRYARSFPELLAQQSPAVDPSNLNAAIDLALVLQNEGERERAAQLLDRSEALILTITRMGPWGYGVADAQIHALRGDKTKALSALRMAEKAGWRGPLWRYYRDFDSNLASIRDDPEFRAVFAGIESDMARQRAAIAARPRDAPLDQGPAH